MTTNALELRAVPAPATVVWQQFRLLGLSSRWLWLTAALATLLVLTGFAPELDAPRPLLVGLLAMPAGVIWAMSVWQGETPRRRAYHWSQPVSRPLSDAARVLAGAAYLVGAYLVVALLGALWTAIDGDFGVWRASGVAAWTGYLVAPLIVYLFVMPLVLWSDYRATKWILGVLCGIPPLMVLLQRMGINGPAEAWVSLMVGGDLSLASALFDPILIGADANWWLAMLAWGGAGLLLTAAAAVWRPDDLRTGARRG